MKKKVFLAAALSCALCFGFVSCGDDENNNVTPPVDNPTDPEVLDVNATYSENTLTLTYSGSEMPGKSVAFNTTDGKTALTRRRLTLSPLSARVFSPEN